MNKVIEIPKFNYYYEKIINIYKQKIQDEIRTQYLEEKAYLEKNGTTLPGPNDYPRVPPTQEQIKSWRNSTKESLLASNKASLWMVYKKLEEMDQTDQTRLSYSRDESEDETECIG